nr:BTB/POZ and MATH domain-containing protein 2-like [Aegilops tauschii subsp. strangulata]
MSSGSSTIMADTVRGHYYLKIDGYSLVIFFHVKKGPAGKKIRARTSRDSNQRHGKVEAPVRLDVWECPKFVKRKALEKSSHLKDDSFTIRCDIIVLNEFRAKEGLPPGPALGSIPVPPSDLGQQLGDLLAADKGADVVFEVGGETFPAHRCLLAARSPVFSAELFGSMRESTGAGAVRVSDMEAGVFRALLRFVYTDSWPPETAEGEEFAMAQHLLVAADKYRMERLKLICEDKLCKNIAAGTAASILALAEVHHCHELKGACFHFLNSPKNLTAAMAGDDFENLRSSFHSLVKELIAKCSIDASAQ